MEALQIVVGVVLALLGVLAFHRTRRLIDLVASMEQPPVTQAHLDRITGIVFAYHLIAGLTVLGGLGVVLMALAG